MIGSMLSGWSLAFGLFLLFCFVCFCILFVDPSPSGRGASFTLYDDFTATEP